MASYINIPFTVDPDDLADAAVAYLQNAIPGWQPADGHLEMWLIEALARLTVEASTVAAQVPAAVFQSFGTSLLQLPPKTGSAATMTSTWVMADAAGYTIPAGVQVGYALSGDTTLIFETTAPIVIAPGNTSTAVGGVTLQSVDAGSQYNGIPTNVGLVLIDSYAFVSTVTTASVSSGGSDPETDAAYLNRLATDLQLLTPRPILPSDFATLAQNVSGVYRALGISGYNPDDNTYNNERYVAVALVDSSGNPVGTATKAAVASYLDGLREINFVVKTMDPTYTTINVAYTIHVSTGADPTATLSAVDSTVRAFLSPGTFNGGDQVPPVWISDTKVRYLKLVAAMAEVSGVDYVASLTLNGGTSDVTMSGAAPLPTVGTLTNGTV